MVKKKQLGIFDYAKSLWDFSFYKNNINFNSLLTYVAVMYIATTFLAVILFYREYGSSYDIGRFFSNLLSMPLVLLITYFFMDVFIKAFSDAKKKFFTGFLVFAGCTLPFIGIGLIILNFALGTPDAVIIFVSFILLMLLIYYVINIIINLSVYYDTTKSKVIASFIITNLLYLMIIVIIYVAYFTSVIVGGAQAGIV